MMAADTHCGNLQKGRCGVVAPSNAHLTVALPLMGLIEVVHILSEYRKARLARSGPTLRYSWRTVHARRHQAPHEAHVPHPPRHEDPCRVSSELSGNAAPYGGRILHQLRAASCVRPTPFRLQEARDCLNQRMYSHAMAVAHPSAADPRPCPGLRCEPRPADLAATAVPGGSGTPLSLASPPAEPAGLIYQGDCPFGAQLLEKQDRRVGPPILLTDVVASELEYPFQPPSAMNSIGDGGVGGGLVGVGTGHRSCG